METFPSYLRLSIDYDYELRAEHDRLETSSVFIYSISMRYQSANER